MNTNSLIQEVKNKLSTKQKVELFNYLYQDISGKGIKGDTKLAHINTFESRILRMLGGSGTINQETGLKQYFGGGGGGGGPAPDTTTSFVREAPGIEERKLELMDMSRDLIQTPEKLPTMQIAPLSGMEQQGITAAGQTGVGQATTQQGIASALQGIQGPNISQFFNPYQSYVTNEIARQGQIQGNQISANAIRSGAFGGGREGVQLAENQARTLGLIGQSQATGFNTALGAAQNQQQAQLTGGQLLGQLGTTQQQQAQGDINQLMASGGLQRQLAQQALDATRQSTLQQQYEPYQRLEFLKNQYAAGPTSQSGITATTAPAANPLAQSIGTGLGAFAAYQGVTNPGKKA
jgi:hypothetical protein